jgi:hypothetical protein
LPDFGIQRFLSNTGSLGLGWKYVTVVKTVKTVKLVEVYVWTIIPYSVDPPQTEF